MRLMQTSLVHVWLTDSAAVITSIASLIAATGVFINRKHLKDVKREIKKVNGDAK